MRYANHTTSYFVFSQIPRKLTQHHADMLEMLVPHLHVVIIRALCGVEKPTPQPKMILSLLTLREQETLQWMCTGKTNGEIAQLMHISESTIKNHAQSIFKKLEVSTRSQAVARAVAEGLSK